MTETVEITVVERGPRLGNLEFPPIQPLFATEDEAHQEALMCFMPMLRRLEIFYDSDEFNERMSDKRVVAEFQKVWSIWKMYVRKP